VREGYGAVEEAEQGATSMAGKAKKSSGKSGSARASSERRRSEVIELEATESVELRCGSASLVLTQDGEILLNGVQIALRANGDIKLAGIVRMN
jgi:hypothetical protein